MKILFVLLLTFGAFAEDANQVVDALSSSFEKVAEDVTHSVVTIKAISKSKKALPDFKGQVDPFSEEMLKKFFGDRIPEFGRKQGMGTGFVYDNEGHIITNHHVVAGADDITVILDNDKQYKAKLIGSDERSDIAVLQIKYTDLKPVVIGDSDNIKIGQWVVAVGNPFGLNNSITAGIISAKGRTISGGSQYEDFIQTDAAINMGNSGGPLVNLKGEVIGINTAIFSTSGGNVGIGFAIPTNMAKKIIVPLLTGGKVVRGWLGVTIQDVSEDLAESFGYKETKGALVGQLQNGSPAEKAKIQAGDIITSIDGVAVKDVNTLRNTIGATSPGTEITLGIFREGKVQDIKVKLEELKDEVKQEEAKKDFDELGLIVQDVTPELGRIYGSESIGKVMAIQVEPNGLAAESGIQRGDVILRLGNVEIKSAKDFYAEIKKADLSKGIRLMVEADGVARFVSVKKTAE